MLATDNAPLTEDPAARKTERFAGIYPVALAARLVRIPLRYARSYARQRDRAGKPWGKQSCRREYYLNFRDLMELRVAWSLHKSGMPWQEICQFARHDSKRFGDKGHVMSHRLFLTHEHRVFKRYSVEMEALTAPIEYDEQGAPLMWSISQEWEIAEEDAVVIIHPGLSFGYPVLKGCYVPTYILHDAANAEQGDYHTVAEDYEVTVTQVRLAHRFETMLWRDDAIPS